MCLENLENFLVFFSLVHLVSLRAINVNQHQVLYLLSSDSIADHLVTTQNLLLRQLRFQFEFLQVLIKKIFIHVFFQIPPYRGILRNLLQNQISWTAHFLQVFRRKKAPRYLLILIFDINRLSSLPSDWATQLQQPILLKLFLQFLLPNLLVDLVLIFGYFLGLFVLKRKNGQVDLDFCLGQLL